MRQQMNLATGPTYDEEGIPKGSNAVVIETTTTHSLQKYRSDPPPYITLPALTQIYGVAWCRLTTYFLVKSYPTDPTDKQNPQTKGKEHGRSRAPQHFSRLPIPGRTGHDVLVGGGLRL